MIDKNIEKILEKELIKFSKENKNVVSLFRGYYFDADYGMEKDHRSYYLIQRNPKCDFELMKNTAGIEYDAYHKLGYDCSIVAWPFQPGKEDEFFGECIWKESD